MPIYVYINPDTEEEYEVIRSMSDNSDFYSPEGIKCCKKITAPSLYDKNKEVWKYNDVKHFKPRTVKRQDGIIEKYDPTKHC